MADFSQLTIGENTYNVKDPEARTQVSTMPTASADLLGKIVQFTGTTGGGYTNGYFYKCTEPTSGTYTWEEINVQAGGGGSSVQSDWNQTNTSAADYIKNKPTIYTPATTGTAGQVLTSNGTDTPVWKTGETIHISTNNSGTTGSAETDQFNRTQWIGTCDGVTSLYDGLTIQYKIPVAGISKGDSLNINNLGEHPVLMNAATLMTTHYPIGAILILVYDSTQTASIYVNNVNTPFTGCWKIHNYDSNTTYTNQKLGNGYGTCGTAASTAAKVVTLTDYTLVINGYVSVKFTYDVPANATLNINSKGAKNIYYRGAKIVANIIKAGDIATFVYDGTQYQLVSIDHSSKAAASSGTDLSLVTTGEKYTWNNKSDLAIGTTATTAAAGNHTHALTMATDTGTSALTMAANTKYKLTAGGKTFIFTTPPDVGSTNEGLGNGYGTCGTAASTAAKVVTLTNYVLTKNGYVSVKFTYNVPANATLNINSRGAKNIYYRGAKIVANIIKAGDIATFVYDGTQYQLVAVIPARTKHTLLYSGSITGGTTLALSYNLFPSTAIDIFVKVVISPGTGITDVGYYGFGYGIQGPGHKIYLTGTSNKILSYSAIPAVQSHPTESTDFHFDTSGTLYIYQIDTL